MSSSNEATNRRGFLSHVATGAAIAAGATYASPLVAAAGASSTGDAAFDAPFDDSWTRRVTAAKHRAVFDSPEVNEGLALSHATFFMQGYKEQLNISGGDVVPVVVMRHVATIMAMNDALWEKYGFGERAKLKDPTTGADYKRNPFIRIETGDKNALVQPEASLESLRASGAVLLACNKAAMRIASQVATRMNLDVEQVRTEFRSGLVPGVFLQPSGIYASLRAQEVGCTFIKST